MFKNHQVASLHSDDSANLLLLLVDACSFDFDSSRNTLANFLVLLVL